MTLFTCLVTAHRDLRLRAKKCFFKFQSQVFAQIGSALHAIATAAAPAPSAEHVAKSKELTEDVAEVLKDCRIKSRTLRRAAQTCVAIAVVNRSFFRVGEYRIGLADFLKLLFRVRIVRISVRMILQGQFPIRGLELCLGDCASHPEYFVVIALCVSGQFNPSFFLAPLQCSDPRPLLRPPKTAVEKYQTSRDGLRDRARDTRVIQNPCHWARPGFLHLRSVHVQNAHRGPAHKQQASASPPLMPEDSLFHHPAEPTPA